MMPHVTLQDVEDVMMQVQKEEQEATTDDNNVVRNVFKNLGDASVFIEEKPKLTKAPASVFDTLEATVKYQSYVRRQHKDLESWRKAQGLHIPPDVVYTREFLPMLSNEELEKLESARPQTFAEASQISGLTPNSLVYLYHHVNRRSKNVISREEMLAYRQSRD
jgi:tRNA U34 5-carboxymethylaminomethyl modifying enzyme MnmG/GidA